jgi:hypothetical protein
VQTDTAETTLLCLNVSAQKFANQAHTKINPGYPHVKRVRRERISLKVAKIVALQTAVF